MKHLILKRTPAPYGTTIENFLNSASDETSAPEVIRQC
jgi:hypothetical protein